MAKWLRVVRGSRLAQIIVGLGVLLFVPRASQAGTITFSFQGNATGISASDMDPALIGVTLPFSGTFTVDDTDLNPSASAGLYDCSSCALPVWTLDIAGLSIFGNSASVNLTTSGQFSVFLGNAATSGFDPASFVAFNLGYGAGVFSDDSLPATIPFPISSQASRIQVYRASGYDLYFFPVVLAAPGPGDTTPVPEPGALVLLGTGLLLIAQRVARARRA